MPVRLGKPAILAIAIAIIQTMGHNWVNGTAPEQSILSWIRLNTTLGMYKLLRYRLCVIHNSVNKLIINFHVQTLHCTSFNECHWMSSYSIFPNLTDVKTWITVIAKKVAFSRTWATMQKWWTIIHSKLKLLHA